MSNVKLNKTNRRVEVKAFELDNAIVFNYFDKLPEKKRMRH